ncbi:MAG: ABC transporter ATP-binding protein/permease [Clostridia bacterium]|nr:ABC transporter ATP-binding protein/permease [Clostridia bacterium]
MASKNSVFKVRFDASSKEYSSKFNASTAKFVFKQMKPYSFKIALFAVLTVLFSYTYVRIPRILGQIIDVYTSAIISSVIKGAENIDIPKPVSLLVYAAVFLILNTVFSALQGMISSGISSSHADRLRNKVFAKIGRISISYTDVASKKHIMDVATESIDAFNQSTNLIINQIFSAIIMIIAIIATVVTIDPIAALTMALIIPIQLLLQYILDYAEAGVGRKAINRQPTESTDIRELFSGLKTIQASGRMPEILNEIEKAEKEKASGMASARFFSFITNNSSDLLLGLEIAVISLISAFRINDGIFTIGTLLTIIIYVRKLGNPISQLASFSSVSATLAASSATLREFLDAPEENKDGTETLLPEKAEAIEISNVTFTYPNTVKPVISNMTVTVPPTGITAVSGFTGAGKTTVIKLILRLYSPDSGTVSYGGMNIEDIPLDTYRKLFSVINQEATLFETSIAANIAFPEKEYDIEKIKAAAKLAGADEFISKLTDGYDTVFCSEPQNISNGQTQLILIARALYNRSKFIILDEATSFVDVETEEKVSAAMKECSKSCGVIIISHKSSTVKDADNVINIQ